jgi:hypothetical protein
MTHNYIVLSDNLNLEGIAERKSEIKITNKFDNGEEETVILPKAMFKIGDEIEIDLSILDESQLITLCGHEASLAIVRLNTGYTEESKKQGNAKDLYKIKIANKSEYFNVVLEEEKINMFCSNWEDKKAYILNPNFAETFTPLIDKFYLKQIATNKKTVKNI